jgi:transcriptional regulator with XRE-family HTH domain
MNQPDIAPKIKQEFTPTDYQKRFKEGRLAAGASLQSVAEAVGISLQAIGQFELGKQSMKIDNFLKACEFLNLRTDYVLHGTGSRFVLGKRPAPTRRGGRPADRA